MAMMDALQRLVDEGESCCGFSDIITDPPRGTTDAAPADHKSESMLPPPTNTDLNPSQVSAVESCSEAVSLIWGPPGMFGFLFLLISNSDDGLS
jgi:hypothetical protein